MQPAKAFMSKAHLDGHDGAAALGHRADGVLQPPRNHANHADLCSGQQEEWGGPAQPCCASAGAVQSSLT